MSQAALQFRRLNLEIAALRQQIRDPNGFPTEQQRAIAMNKVTALNRQHNHLLSMLNTTGTGVGLSDVPHLQPGMLGYGQPNYGVDRMGVYRGGQSYGGQGAQINQRQQQLASPQPSPQRVQHEPSDSPEITAADFEAIDRVEKALNEENKETEPGEDDDDDDQPDLVAVETEFSEKDMLCPYSAKVMQTPMKSKSCGHRLDRESLKALIDYFNSKQKELGRKNKPSQSSNCPIYGCKGLWTHKGSVIDKELRAKIQNFQKNKGINSLGSSGNPGAPAGASSTAATATAAAAAGGNGRKRKAPEVLDLCSDSESEDAQPQPEPPAASAAAPAVTSASSSSSSSESGAAMPLQPSIQSQDGATTREASPSAPSSSTPNGNTNAIGHVPVSGSSSSFISTTNGVAAQSPLRAFHTSELREELLKEKALTKQLTAERKSLEGFITKRKSAKTKAQNKLDETGKLQQQLQTAQEDNQILQKVVLGLQEFVKAAKERDSNNNEDVY